VLIDGYYTAGSTATTVAVSNNAVLLIEITGNLMNIAGTAAIPNPFGGIFLRNSATGNVIGGAAAGARNVISGNGNGGVTFANGSSDNVVTGNYIGVDVTGLAPLGNTTWGINGFEASDRNRIGGTGAGEANIIAFTTGGRCHAGHR
jgi:titin